LAWRVSIRRAEHPCPIIKSSGTTTGPGTAEGGECGIESDASPYCGQIHVLIRADGLSLASFYDKVNYRNDDHKIAGISAGSSVTSQYTDNLPEVDRIGSDVCGGGIVVFCSRTRDGGEARRIALRTEVPLKV